MSLKSGLKSKLLELASSRLLEYIDGKKIVGGILDRLAGRNASTGLLERLEALVDYLHRYGYLGGTDRDKVGLPEIIRGVILFRKMFHLGEPENEATPIDPEVLSAINYPRCACTDFDPNTPLSLEAEAATNQGYWGLKTLTWFLKKPVRALPVESQRRIIKSCYDNTSTICDLEFREVFKESEANIVIDCGNSGNGIGSPGSVLAWAYLPPSPNFKGQLLVMMDDAEKWKDDGDSGPGIFYRNVFQHESAAGHSLGLSHSRVKSALMAPYYSPSVSQPVSPDDIERLQALYGKPKPKPVTPTIPPSAPPQGGEEMTIILNGTITIPGYLIVKK